MGLMDLFQQGDMREKLYSAASRNNVPQGGVTGAMFKGMFPHGAGNVLFGREPEPMPPLESPEGTAFMADLASNMMVPGTFIGPGGMMKALGRDKALDTVLKAESALKSGVSREQVFRDFGVFRGPEGKWRYEIDDSGMKFADDISEKMSGGNVPGISDVIEHDELFKAAPSLKGSGFEYSPAIQGAGQYDPIRDVVTINPFLGGQKSTTLHEIQHAIQDAEDMARGGSPSGMSAAGMGGIMPNEFKTQAGETVKLSGGSGYIVFPNGKFQRITPESAHAIWKKEGGPTSFDQYENLAGEAESRAVQDRMNMTMQERRASFPRYATRNDLIVRGLMSGGK